MKKLRFVSTIVVILITLLESINYQKVLIRHYQDGLRELPPLIVSILNLCFFCQKSYAKVSGEKHVIAAESMKSKLLEIAEKPNYELAANVIAVISRCSSSIS